MNKLENARNKINQIDKEIAKLFEERMNAVKEVIEYKEENNLNIFDETREQEVIKRNLDLINNDQLKPYFEEYLISSMNISKKYQQLNSHNILNNIVIQRNGLDNVENYFDLNRKVLVITDDGVPREYAQKVMNKSKEAFVYVIPQGEASKNFTNYSTILSYMLENEFSRTDCIVAVGGGVVGDLSGFVASTYMRGIDFYNVPTTLLSQVDSSIGGKTAIDKDNFKNTVGTFYNPSKVLIDTNVLLSLDQRQINAGLVESIKMGFTSNEKLVEIIENSSNLFDNIDEIIKLSLKVKSDVVLVDPKEKNIRKILNFGHTIGHAIESSNKFNLLHGECVGLGMMYFVDNSLKDRLSKILRKYNLPTEINIDKEEIYKYISLDKKRNGNYITIIKVDKIGTYKIEKIKMEDIKNYL